MQRNENRMQCGRIFSGRIWLKKRSFSYDDDDDDDTVSILIVSLK
jgi:hypothetical protein